MEELLQKLTSISAEYTSKEDVFSKELSKRTEIAKEHLKVIQSASTLIQEVIKEYTDKYQVLKTEYDSLNSSFKLLSDNQKDSMDLYEAKIAASKETLASLDKDYKALSDKIEKMQNAYDSSIIRREEFKEELVKVQNNLSNLEAEERGYIKHIDDLKAEKESLEKEVGDLSNKRDLVNDELRIKNQEISRLALLAK